MTTALNPEDRLCGGEAGFAARVTGRSSDVDMCIHDDDVASVLTIAPDRYNVTARLTADGDVFEVQIIMNYRDDFPVTLTPTANLAELDTNPDAVYVYFIESPSEGATIESIAVTSGSFLLSFSGGDVIAGTFSRVAMDMQTQGTSEAAGQRMLSEGFFSLSVLTP